MLPLHGLDVPHSGPTFQKKTVSSGTLFSNGYIWNRPIGYRYFKLKRKAGADLWVKERPELVGQYAARDSLTTKHGMVPSVTLVVSPSLCTHGARQG